MAALGFGTAPWLSTFRLRRLFYMVSPNETTYDGLSAVPSFSFESIPWFVALICIEYLFMQIKSKGRGNYAVNDSVTATCTAELSFLSSIALGGAVLRVYCTLYDKYRLVDLSGTSPWVWTLCFFTQDLAYYWAHRATHEIGILWAFHQTHHSSEYYNLVQANRQAIVQDIAYEGLTHDEIHLN